MPIKTFSQAYLIVIFLISSLLVNIPIKSHSQSVISGAVSDNLNEPLPFANVYLKQNGVILKITSTDNVGKYSMFSIDTGRYEFNVSAIGYKRHSQYIHLNNANPTTINILLLPDTMVLDQIIIVGESAIKSKGDTLIYDTKYFSTGEESVLEDLLKKLPGFEILENGKVQFQGKDIRKIKIENDDLVNTNYSLLTKNLSADLIENVEVLQDYSDNPLLKGIENSDDVALNLTLKEDRKAKLFGDLKLGSNLQERHEVKLNLVSFFKRLKVYGLTNLNSIGEDPTGDIQEMINSSQIEGRVVGDGTTSEDIVNVSKPSIQEFKRDRYIFNQSKFVSVSSIYRPVKNLSINVTGYLYDDRLPFQMWSTSQYFLPSDTVNYNEAIKSQNDEFIKYLRATVSYQINEKSNLSYTYLYSTSNRAEDQDYVFNLTNISKMLDTKSLITNQHINYTNRISQKRAFTFDFRYINDSRPQAILINGNVLNSFFPNTPPSDTVYQSTNFSTEFLGLEGNLFANVKKSKFGVRLGLKKTEQVLLSNLSSTETNLSQNLLKLNQNETYLNTYYTASLSNFSFTPSILIQQINSTIFDRNTYDPIFLNPKGLFKWKPSNENIVSALFSLNNSLSKTTQLYVNPIALNYNLVSVTDSSFRSFSNRTILVNYIYGGWGKGVTINSTFLYQKAPNSYLSNTTIESNYIFTEVNRVADREIASLSFSVDKYLKKISSSIKLTVNNSSSSFVTSLDGIPTDTKSKTNKIELSLRSAFTGQINFHIGQIVNHSSSTSQFIDENNYYLQQYFDLYLRGFSNNLNLNVHFERFDLISLLDRPVYNFLDINFKYQPTKSRFSIYVKGKNLLNERLYKQRTVSSKNVSTITNQLISRYILLGCNIRL